MNLIARLIDRLRGYFVGVQRSRDDLTDSTLSENALPPQRRGDGTQPK